MYKKKSGNQRKIMFLTLLALRVISVKFLHAISLLYKNRVVMRIKDMTTQDECN